MRPSGEQVGLVCQNQCSTPESLTQTIFNQFYWQADKTRRALQKIKKTLHCCSGFQYSRKVRENKEYQVYL